MMNLSQLLTSLKMDLGIYGLVLPFENPDQALVDTIKLRTLKTFSVFNPQVLNLTINLNELTCLKSHYTHSTYILPEAFGGRTLLYVRKLNARNKLIGNGYVSPQLDDSIDTYNMLMLTQANANLVSVAAPPITFKFEAPNILHIYNMATMYGEVDIELAVEHAENLSTINPTTWESFYELALLDVKRFLYNTLKHYNEIQTAYGTIVLKIDDWSNAESDRKDLIEKWRDFAHLDVESFYVI